MYDTALSAQVYLTDRLREPTVIDASEHGIYQTLKTALYQYTIHLQHHPVPASLADTLLRTQGPDGGLHTGYDQAGTYNGTLENTETTSIVIITLSSLTQSMAFPAWILITGIATLVAGAFAILIVLVLDDRRNREFHSGVRRTLSMAR